MIRLKLIFILVQILFLFSCTNSSDNSSEPENNKPYITISTENNNVHYFKSDRIIIKAQIGDLDGISDVKKVIFYLNGADYEISSADFTAVNSSLANVNFELPAQLDLSALKNLNIKAEVYDYAEKKADSNELNLLIVEGSNFEEQTISKTGYKKIAELITEHGTDFIINNMRFPFYQSGQELWKGFSYANLNFDPESEDHLAAYYRPNFVTTVPPEKNQYLCISDIVDEENLASKSAIQFFAQKGVKPISVLVNLSEYSAEKIKESLFYDKDRSDQVKLLITAYDSGVGGNKIGSKEHILADCTSINPYTDDTVSAEWIKLDLESLGSNVKRIEFDIISSRDEEENSTGDFNFIVLDDLKVENNN